MQHSIYPPPPSLAISNQLRLSVVFIGGSELDMQSITGYRKNIIQKSNRVTTADGDSMQLIVTLDV